ncbi:MAG TPA: ferritin-like domain-containing protein [Fimbriimonas sp.]
MQELVIDTLKDTYNAEKQILKALPKMEKAATHPKLKEMFRKHLVQTEDHVKRLEEAAKMLKTKPTGKVCKGMQGLIEEGEEAIKEFAGNEVGDAALIVAAQKVEHYEIGAYGTIITWCEQMGLQEVANALKPTLNDEETTDKMLTDVAEGEINRKAIAMPAPEKAKAPAKKSTSNSTPRGKVSVR